MYNKGFTLIELLVVVSIISLLSSVVLSSFNQVREKARDTQRIEDLVQMRNALEMYYLDNGSYPVSNSESWDSLRPGGGYGPHTLDILISSGYISELPIDPNSQTTGTRGYLYRSNGDDYALLAHNTIESFDPDEGHPLDRINYDQQTISVCTGIACEW